MSGEFHAVFKNRAKNWYLKARFEFLFAIQMLLNRFASRPANHGIAFAHLGHGAHGADTEDAVNLVIKERVAIDLDARHVAVQILGRILGGGRFY